MGPIEKELRENGDNWFRLSRKALVVLAGARESLGLRSSFGREAEIVSEAIEAAEALKL